MGRGWIWVGLWSYCLGAACAPAGSTGEPSDGAAGLSEPGVETPSLPLTADGAIDTSGGSVRVIAVPSVGDVSIVSTPHGYFAVSSRSFNSGKEIVGYASALYRSEDGVSWRRVPLADDEDLELTDLAYGNGRFVMVGRRLASGHIYRVSRNGSDWTERAQGLDIVLAHRRLAFAGGRFFGLVGRQLGVSHNGEDWSLVPIALVQPMAIAHGNGHYVLMGSGPVEVSPDGLTWSAHELACELPGACIRDPSGAIHQSVQRHLVFAEGRFYSDQLTSEDGISWQAMPGRYPVAYADGFFFEPTGSELAVWTSNDREQRLTVRASPISVTVDGREGLTSLDAEEPLPEIVDTSFPDGLTCKDAACVIVANRLYLFPPPGTPELASP